MIEAFRLGAASRGRTVFEGVDLAIGEGEVWVVAGPPGSGKTLLLRILRGALSPDSGDVLVGGESLFRGDGRGAAGYRAASGVVPETPAPPREDGAGGGGRTAGELFLLSAAAAGGIPRAERRRREEELLALLGLSAPPCGGEGLHPEDPRDRPLSSFSLSERARLHLAVELLRGPRYLFADMVVANAGDAWEDTLGALFRALAREGTTVVLAERALPAGWAPRAAPAVAAGPFALHRVAAPPGAPPPWEPSPPDAAAGTTSGEEASRGGAPGTEAPEAHREEGPARDEGPGRETPGTPGTPAVRGPAADGGPPPEGGEGE